MHLVCKSEAQKIPQSNPVINLNHYHNVLSLKGEQLSDSLISYYIVKMYLDKQMKNGGKLFFYGHRGSERTFTEKNSE